jgi:hypothetical protein
MTRRVVQRQPWLSATVAGSSTIVIVCAAPAFLHMHRRLFAFTTGYLLLQILVAYEWFASGLTKLVHGDFPAGLAADLRDPAKQAVPWYGDFLRSAVIPHGVASATRSSSWSSCRAPS